MLNKEHIKKQFLLLLIIVFLSIAGLATNVNAETNTIQSSKIIALYNSTKVTGDDMTAINNFIKQKNYELIDISNCNTSQQIYDMLKEKSKQENIKGIQIFGIDNDVKSFQIQYKALTRDGVDGNYIPIKTDYFYSNLSNDSSKLNEQFSVYDNFQNNLNVNLYPQFPVTRLLITTGEYSSFFNKYNDYINQNKIMPIVDFSCPIFATSNATDNEGVFLNNLNNDNILNANQYKLYGNLDGAFPVSNKVLGNYTTDNLSKENANGTNQFVINCHGDNSSVEKCIFDSNGKQQDETFINTDNINNILSGNYYQLDLISCGSAQKLDNNTIIYKILSSGKCVDAIGASSMVSCNGMDDGNDMKGVGKCNLYDFYYWLIKGMYQDNLSKSQSFLSGQQHYYTDIMNNTDNIYDHNYQYNLYNLIGYEHFGLLDNSNIINNGLYNYSKTLNKNKGDTVNINFNKNIKSCDIKMENSNGDIFTPQYDIKNNKISVKLDDFEKGEYTLFVNGASSDYNNTLSKKYQCNFILN